MTNLTNNEHHDEAHITKPIFVSRTRRLLIEKAHYVGQASMQEVTREDM